MEKFKKYSFEKRLSESTRIKEKFPNRVPVIVERGTNNIKDIDKKKYLVPTDITVGQFIYVIRKRIDLSADQALYLFVDDTLPTTSELMGIEYANKKDDDGFLYITYSGESTFGKIFKFKKIDIKFKYV